MNVLNWLSQKNVEKEYKIEDKGYSGEITFQVYCEIIELNSPDITKC